MSHHIAHFAIHADDPLRARAFYEGVFGWTFTPWGPPDFWMISTGEGPEGAPHGSLQRRREPVSGSGVTGYECTIAVQDVEAISAAIESAGGRITMPLFTLPGIGRMVQFQDSEGNGAVAMHYDETAADED